MSSSNFKAMLAEAKRPERIVRVCLRGDLAAVHEDLDQQLKQAADRPVTSKEDPGPGPLIERIEALQAQMAEHAYPFRLRALPRHTFRALVAEHPPRKDDDGGVLKEDVLGVNQATFFPAMIRAAVIDPVLDEADWTDLLDDKLTEYQFQELAWAAWKLNDSEVDVPFSRAASLAKRATESE